MSTRASRLMVVGVLLVGAAGSCVWQGARRAAAELQPHVFVPMHAQCPDKYGVYERFREGTTVPVLAATRRGEWFHYQAGRVTQPD